MSVAYFSRTFSDLGMSDNSCYMASPGQQQDLQGRCRHTGSIHAGDMKIGVMHCRDGVVVVEVVIQEWERLADSRRNSLCAYVMQAWVLIKSDLKTHSS